MGILALQGDFEKHRQMLERIGHKAALVRTKAELDLVAGLIIPGGESTTLTNLMKKHELWKEIVAFGKQKPIFGTCAGLIILSKQVTSSYVETLGLIDITVARNAYGRQVDSFIDDLRLTLNGKPETTEGVFIRAPKIVAIGQTVKPLAWHKDDIVMAESGNILVATFHPELTDDARVHEYFLRKVDKTNSFAS
jgi:5'-phosphate synthase pdxT subunit